jgi:hypothetical protein
MEKKNGFALKPTLALAALLVAASALVAGCGFSSITVPTSAATKASGPNAGTPASTTPATVVQAIQAPNISAGGWMAEPAFKAKASAAAAPTTSIDPTTGNIDLYYQANIKIPYGWVYEAASLAVKAAEPLACQFGGVETEASPYTAYASGEIPCGKIVGNGFKEVDSVTIPGYYKKSGPITLQSDSATVGVLISRQQFTGSYQEPRLDSRSTETLTTSPNFGDDISVQWDPSADGMSTVLHLCAAMPGVQATVTPFAISAKATLQELLKITVGSKFDISPGQAQFNYARGCFSTTIAFASGALVPTISFAVDQDPVVDGATYSGLEIKIENQFLAFLDDILSWFRTGLRAIAKKYATGEFISYDDSELQNGHWFVTANGVQAVANLGTTVNNSIVKAVNSAGLPLTTSDMRALIARQCSLLPLVSSLDPNFAADCLTALNSISIAVQPFYRDPALASAGCYDYYANINQTGVLTGQEKWWANGCDFSMQLQFRVQTQLTPQQTAAINQALTDLSNIETLVQQEEAKLGIPSSTLGQLTYLIDLAAKNNDVVKSLEDLLKIAPKYQSVIQSELQGWAASI